MPQASRIKITTNSGSQHNRRSEVGTDCYMQLRQQLLLLVQDLFNGRVAVDAQLNDRPLDLFLVVRRKVQKSLHAVALMLNDNSIGISLSDLTELIPE